MPMKKVTIILAIALMIRLVVVYLFPQDAPDSPRYNAVAMNMLSGKGFTNASGEPHIVDGPIYPSFLALIYSIFGQSFQAVRNVQCFIDVITCMIVYFLAMGICKNRKIAFLSLIIASVYPELVGSCSFVLSESLFTLLFSVSIVMLVQGLQHNRIIQFVLSGILLGVATLCRSVGLLLPLFLLIGSIVFSEERKKMVIASLLLFITMAATISPWTIRNYIVFRKVIPVNVGLGGNLWMGSYLPWNGDWNYKNPEPFHKLGEGLSTIESDRRRMSEGVKHIKAHPMKYGLMCIRKMGRFWFQIPGGKEVLRKTRFLKSVLYLLYAINVLILSSSVIGLLHLKRWRESRILVPILAIILFTIQHSLLLAIPRYRIPLIPIVIVFAAAGIRSPAFRRAKTKSGLP